MALPMCMGLGCNAAGITGCRILSPGPARTAAILTNALIPCNGRFPALILLAGMLLGAFGLDSALARATVLLLALALSVAATLLLCRCITAHTGSAPNSFLLELPQDDLIWEQERKVVSAEERMQKGQSHLANLKAMMAAKRGK